MWTLHGATVRLKAIISISIVGPTNTTVVRGLLDTGADDTVLPDGIAAHLGIDLSSAPMGQCSTATGTTVAVRFAEVVFRLHDGSQGIEWPARVAFAPLPGTRALLGVAGCLEFSDASFQAYARRLVLTTNPLFPQKA